MLQADALRKKLARFCKTFDTNAIAARKLNVTQAQLSRALSGKSNVIPARIVKKLGFEAVIAYVPAGKTATKTVKVNRDAKTGRTVSKAVAKAHPATTVTETQQRAVKPKTDTAVRHRNAAINAASRPVADEPDDAEDSNVIDVSVRD